MERKRFDDQPCPIAQAANIFGDWWVPLLLREAMYGVETFSGFQENLGISRNILNQRLLRLIEAGIFEKVPSPRADRARYLLTEKGRAALPILAALSAWSNDWVFDQRNYPIELRHKDTLEPVEPVVIDRRTGRPIDVEELVMSPGPGFPPSEEVRRWRFGESGVVPISLGRSPGNSSI